MRLNIQMWRIKLSSFHLTSYFKFILDKHKTKLLSKADFLLFGIVFCAQKQT